MAEFFDALNDEHIAFIHAQQIFFVATACADGRVNLSPKGIESLQVINPHCVAWLDFTGSGNETAAHIHHDGRLTIMLCSFGPEPLILRLYGTGKVINTASSEWPDYCNRFNNHPWLRQFIALDIDSVQTSCGYGVPQYEFIATRQNFDDITTKMGEEFPDFIGRYQQEKNSKSIDGLETGILPINPEAPDKQDK